MHQLGLVNGKVAAELVPQDPHRARDRQVSGTFPKTVHGRMDSAYPGTHGLEGIRSRKVIVIVSVEIETHPRISGNHVADEPEGLGRIEYAERIRQHDPLYACILDGIGKEIHIVLRGLHPAGPVFEVDVHLQSFLPCEGDVPQDIGRVLLRSLPKLPFQMPQGTFGQQVHHPSPA